MSFADKSPGSIMLIPEDFPPSFRRHDGCAHKDDYNITTTPIKPEIFLYRGSNGSRDRLFFRTSIKLSNNPSDQRFTSATFIFDPACFPHFNLSDDLKNLLKDRINREEGREFFISTTIDEEKHLCIVKNDLPHHQKSVNVMGLPILFAMGVTFKKGQIWGFPLDEEDVAHEIADLGSFRFI